MNLNDIKRILAEIEAGKMGADEALKSFAEMPYADYCVAKHDTHRPLRNGFSEVIFCEGKSREQIIRIASEMAKREINVFGTRANEDVLSEIARSFGDAIVDPVSRTFRIIKRQVEIGRGEVAILCAGTADMPVAEEARVTLEFSGIEAKRFYDVGVAGLHRLLKSTGEMRSLDCAIVVAGMEGALPSVVGGLLPVPIVAVPTSVGYGASFGGIAALLAMLNSCSEGITVVNIDNGFGAACAALRIIRRSDA
jgi:NCAIR mutase (PurE)-related protein